MKHTVLWLASALLLGACEFPEVISNGDIDSWCGDVPCGWAVDGTVRRVSTWHSHDYAASLESDGARLHQLNDDISYPCLTFSMVAKVGKGAKAFVELDFIEGDDGAEWTRPIPETNFETLTFHATMPEWYSSVRFIVRKEGSGEVVIAQLRATYEGSEACTEKPIDLKHLPGRAPCDADADCVSGTCRTGYCVGCASDDECSDERVCGYETVGVFYANALPQCVEPQSRRLGALCLGDDECETGLCCEGVCSACCGEVGCDGGSTCQPSLAGDGEETVIREPHLCSAGLNKGDVGDPCTSDDDCQGSCGSYECTGLCSLLAVVGNTCAQLACEAAECSSQECGVETVEVGRCQ